MRRRAACVWPSVLIPLMKKCGVLCAADVPEVGSPGACEEEAEMTTFPARRSAGGNRLWLYGHLNSYEYGCSVCETPDSAFLIRRVAMVVITGSHSDGRVVMVAAGSYTCDA
jgi:hypothetical protein